MVAVLKQISAKIQTVIDLRDIFFFLGLSSLVYGISLVYVPAAWIIGGGTFVVLGWRR